MYGGHSPLYSLPFMKKGDLLSSVEEENKARIIENTLRAGILGAGSTRVFIEGGYAVVINPDLTVTINLNGTPSLQGIANQGLVEVFGQIQWPTLPVGTFWYLYIVADTSTFLDPAAINVDARAVPILLSTHLYLATLDNTVPGAPVLNTNPPGKPIGANLFTLLNSPIDPFGALLSQSNLDVLNRLHITTGLNEENFIRQWNPAATQALLRFDNLSAQPDIKGTIELAFADSRIAFIQLTDVLNATLPLGAASLLGALNRTAYNQPVFLTDAVLITTNAALSNSFAVTLQGNRTLSNPTNSTDGQRVTWRIKQDAVGTRTITLGTKFRLGTDIPVVTLTVTALKTDYLTAVYNLAADTWDVVDFKKGF